MGSIHFYLYNALVASTVDDDDTGEILLVRLSRICKRVTGYLGVGVQKRKLGVGTILILVTDLEGTIIIVESCQV